MPVSRRAFLLSASGLTAAALFPHRPVLAQPRYQKNPFALGVASGYPLPGSVVLWTRLAPEPLNGGGMPRQPVEVQWELADDDGFRKIIRSGKAVATPEFAHSVRVEVAGLEPSRWYWYRFHSGKAESPVGRTRTAPVPESTPERMRFAFASCQHYEHGYYGAYRHMAADDLDLVIHLGDYIYEGSWGRNNVRAHEAGEPITLAEYRDRHALYKTDPSLQAAHASFPWLVTWDDHEVDNDYAGAYSQDGDPPELFLKRRAAAYQAYYEHMPLPPWAQPRGPDMRIHARASFGRLAQFHLLDDRQYRSRQACPRPGRGGSNVVEECAARLDPRRTMLGTAQKKWLFEGLAASDARWNVIAQQTLMAQLNQAVGPGQSFWTDGWDGYPHARAEVLDFIAQRRVANPVVIGGDKHMFVVADLKTDFNNPHAAIVATEVVGTSISSNGPSQKRIESWLSGNPHIRYANAMRRGYVSMELSLRRCLTRLRALEDVRDPGSGIRTIASFVTEDGRPGANRA